MSFTTQLPAAQEYVYVIHATGTNRIKLGYTTNPQGRLAALQTASPFPLQMLACWPGSRAREKRLHRYMAQFRQVGEWFEVPPFVGLKIWELVNKGEVTAQMQKPKKQARREVQTNEMQINLDDVWRIERNGKYYFYRHRFTRETKPGGRITREIEAELLMRKGKGRHRKSRKEGEAYRQINS